MIYSTNRTTSLGDYFTVDVNESYFGAGSLDFMEENAKDELELFEAAIKSDIDECLIGESSYELEALNEGFIENAVNKIKELMKKFIEWIKGVSKSIIAKLSNLILKDNVDFCKKAKKMLVTMKNKGNFKYSGKALDLSKMTSNSDIATDKNNNVENSEYSLYKNIMDNVKNEKYDVIEKYKNEFEEIKEVLEKNKVSVSDILNELVIDVTDQDINFVYEHINILESYSKNNLQEIKKNLKASENNAKRIAKQADNVIKNTKDTKEEGKRELLSLAADVAAFYKKSVQQLRKDNLKLLKKIISVARTVVTKAMGVYQVKENAEYTDELVQAMIETADFELDEIFEEMSEGKECNPECDDEFEDDEE